MSTLLIATYNPGKVREYEKLLAGLPVTVTFPAEAGLELEVEETGDSFEENALIKARAFAQASGLLTLGDDSGLEVDALGGAPGVRSARYAGPDADDRDRCVKLLAELDSVPKEQRSARFRCVVTIVEPPPGGAVLLSEGRCEGRIASSSRGEHGFGYDPVFVVEGYGGQTMAELEPELKNRISHRARAALAIRPKLERLLSERSA